MFSSPDDAGPRVAIIFVRRIKRLRGRAGASCPTLARLHPPREPVARRSREGWLADRPTTPPPACGGLRSARRRRRRRSPRATSAEPCCVLPFHGSDRPRPPDG